MKALHIANPGQSTFRYHSSGPASITLHPELATKIRVLIYNGDADACVYNGDARTHARAGTHINTCWWFGMLP